MGLGSTATRRIGVAVLVAVIAGYVAAAAAVVGILPGSVFVPTAVLGSAAPGVMLAAFFQPSLILGIAIDMALLVAVLALGWRPGQAEL